MILGDPSTPDEDGNASKHQKTTTIIVNTREKKVEGKEITFEQLVQLAFDAPPSGPNIEITIAYRKGHGNKPSNTMKPGDSVKIKEGMIFDVTATDKS